MPMTVDQFRAYRKGRRELSQLKCVGCGQPLQESKTGRRPMSDGDRCSDCYFDILGEAVELRPIFVPRTRRGA